MKAHTVHRLLSSLYGKPHLASKELFREVSAYLSARNAGLLNFDDNDVEDKPAELKSENGVGVISIRGPLTYRTTGWEAMCGGFSYEMLVAQTEEMLAAGATSIVLDVDSGGGEAYGCFESTDMVRQMCDEAGAKLYGYIDGHACSAAYAIICACDEVAINPYGEAGSIGVLIALYNDSEHLKNEGIERIFITDGTEKVPFAENGSFKQEFLDDLQTKCSRLGDEFRNHVSKYTGVSVEDLKATNAKVFSAQDALSLGLVNKIQTRAEFVSYVADKHNGVQ